MKVSSFFGIVAMFLVDLGSIHAQDECQAEWQTCFYTCEQLRKYGGHDSQWWNCYPECAAQKDACDETNTGTLDSDSCLAQREQCYVPCNNMLKYCPNHCPYSGCFNACAARACDSDPTESLEAEPPKRDCQETFNTCFYVCDQQRKFCSQCDWPGCFVGCANDINMCREEQNLGNEVLEGGCNATLDSCVGDCNLDGDCLIECQDDRSLCEEQEPVTPAEVDGLNCAEDFKICFRTCRTLLNHCFTCDIGQCFIDCADDKNKCEYHNLTPETASTTCQDWLHECNGVCDACTECEASLLTECKEGCASEHKVCTGEDTDGDTSGSYVVEGLLPLVFGFLVAGVHFE